MKRLGNWPFMCRISTACITATSVHTNSEPSQQFTVLDFTVWTSPSELQNLKCSKESSPIGQFFQQFVIFPIEIAYFIPFAFYNWEQIKFYWENRFSLLFFFLGFLESQLHKGLQSSRSWARQWHNGQWTSYGQGRRSTLGSTSVPTCITLICLCNGHHRHCSGPEKVWRVQSALKSALVGDRSALRSCENRADWS